MRKSSIIKLKNNLLEDKDYIKYKEIYKNEHFIDKDLLVVLLERYLDLYYVFLKINILLYKYDTKNLDKELQDFLHYKGKNIHVDDLDSIFRFYYKNFSMCHRTIEKIITYKIRNKNEIELLKQILERPFEKELSVFFEYKVVPNE